MHNIMRRLALSILAFFAAFVTLSHNASAQWHPKDTEWPSYNADLMGTLLATIKYGLAVAFPPSEEGERATLTVESKLTARIPDGPGAILAATTPVFRDSTGPKPRRRSSKR